MLTGHESRSGHRDFTGHYPVLFFFLTRSENLEMFLGVSSLFKAWLEQGTRALPCSGSLSHA